MPEAMAMAMSLAEAEALATAALLASRTSRVNAIPTARALVAAEADGQKGHGLSRIPSYALQSKAGKVDGFAVPSIAQTAPAALVVDAAYGFAYPAIDLALAALAPLAKTMGIGVAAIRRSHHFGQAGAHAERLAREGLIALVFGNSPKAMAFWGGQAARLGTNPIAFACPAPGGDPVVIDLALSQAARGRIVAAEAAGEPIPLGWAVDAAGAPTTDAAAALKGSLLPIGGAKGSALALMVELLAAALTGSAFGWEASSMFDDKDGPPDLGHLLIAIDPSRLSTGDFAGRVGSMLQAMAAEPGVRPPGSARLAHRAHAAEHGLTLPAKLRAEIQALAADG